MRLPEAIDNIEQYVDFVGEEVSDLDNFIIIGDSFGAVVALAFATRQSKALEALIFSGGFATNSVINPLIKLKVKAARLLPGALYRAITFRFHAASLASLYDNEGQISWSKKASRKLFKENTPYKSYISCAKTAFSSNYLDKLKLIKVPTLIITPSHDKLIKYEN
jgi:pimeloyl-ACP methyl ester carboxylesterase